jgi:hypothetical protein
MDEAAWQMDPYHLLLETAAVATPAIATWTYASRGRKRLRAALRQPLFWDGGQPVSLATIHDELNAEGDLVGELRERIGGQGPLAIPELEQAVALLQANPAMARQLVLELATSACLRGAMPRSGAPTGVAGMDAAVALLDRLAARQEALGFFAFVAALNEERAPGVPALLPIDALMPGGFPVGPPPDAEPSITDPGGIGLLGVMQAIGVGRQGEWLPGVMRAVGDLVRERQVKKARDGYHRALAVLGKAAGEALRRRTPAGEALRRNVYSPLDAYKNLATRTQAKAPPRPKAKHMLVPSVEMALADEFRASLARATAIVADKCVNLERVLVGRHGEAFAGEVLYKHRAGLLAGVDPAAFPLALVDQAREAYRAARAGEAHSAPEGAGLPPDAGAG